MFHINTIARIVLSVSNIFAILPARRALQQNDYISAALITITGLASAAMHISETKHGIDPGPFLGRWSYWMLNADRFMAVVSMIYFGRMWIKAWYPFERIVGLLFGLAFMYIGERAENVFIYTWFHLLWHFVAYKEMEIVLDIYY